MLAAVEQLSDRISNLAESATLAMAAKAREYKSKGIEVISLSLGEPDFKTPQHICEGAKKAIDDGKYFAYPPVAGYQDLREAIAAKLRNENGLTCEAKKYCSIQWCQAKYSQCVFLTVESGR